MTDLTSMLGVVAIAVAGGIHVWVTRRELQRIRDIAGDLRASHAIEGEAQVRVNEATADAIGSIQSQCNRLAEYIGTVDARTRPPTRSVARDILRPYGNDEVTS